MPNKSLGGKVPAYKCNVHKFPRIFALWRGNKSRMWSYFFFFLTFLVNRCLCFRMRYFRVFRCDPIWHGTIKKTLREYNKAKRYRINSMKSLNTLSRKLLFPSRVNDQIINHHRSQGGPSFQFLWFPRSVSTWEREFV